MTEHPPKAALKSKLSRRHLLAALPILGAGTLGLGFHKILHQMQEGTFDPHLVNNEHLGQKIPSFDPLPSLPLFGDQRDMLSLTPTLLSEQKTPFLLNFLASWCIPCITEIPFLREISSQIPLWGIAYKDKTARLSEFLKRNGQPYSYIGQDISGYCAIDWGVTGVPETFLIFPGGYIAWHGISALTADIYHEEILPLLKKPPSL